MLGQALREALGDKAGIRRFGEATVPLDEALVQTVVDLSGRPFLVYDVKIKQAKIGTFDVELIHDFLLALANQAGMNLHVRMLSGRNPHHIVEATFKGLARALDHGDAARSACTGRALHQGHARRMSRPLAIVDYGVGNLRSAQKAFEHLGQAAEITGDPDRIASAPAVVLPGQGAFGTCMHNLTGAGLVEPVLHAARSGRPFLGICVGMQLLFEESEESPGRARARSVPRPRRALPARPGAEGAAHGLEPAQDREARPRAVPARRRRVGVLRPLVLPRADATRTWSPRRRPTASSSSRASGATTSGPASSTPRRASASGCACWPGFVRTLSDDGLSRDRPARRPLRAPHARRLRPRDGLRRRPGRGGAALGGVRGALAARRRPRRRARRPAGAGRARGAPSARAVRDPGAGGRRAARRGGRWRGARRRRARASSSGPSRCASRLGRGDLPRVPGPGRGRHRRARRHGASGGLARRRGDRRRDGGARGARLGRGGRRLHRHRSRRHRAGPRPRRHARGGTRRRHPGDRVGRRRDARAPARRRGAGGRRRRRASSSAARSTPARSTCATRSRRWA